MYSELAQRVVDGDVNPLEAYVTLKRAADEIKTAMEIVQPLAVSEADKWKEKSFKAYGVIIEKKSNPATWDYSGCEAYEQAQKRLKYIQQIAQIGGGADVDTGEVIGKAIRIEGASNISVKLLKQES